MTNEVWKDAIGYEGLYQVSNFGRIKSMPKKKSGYNESIMLQHNGHHNYKKIHLCKNGVGKVWFVHRLIGLAFNSNPENKPFINHKDGNKENNNAENLEWVTHSENLIHSYRVLNRMPPERKGEKNSMAKLSNKEVLEIRDLFEKGVNAKELSVMFKVQGNHIRRIIRRERRADI